MAWIPYVVWNKMFSSYYTNILTICVWLLREYQVCVVVIICNIFHALVKLIFDCESMFNDICVNLYYCILVTCLHLCLGIGCRILQVDDCFCTGTAHSFFVDYKPYSRSWYKTSIMILEFFESKGKHIFLATMDSSVFSSLYFVNRLF